MLEDDVKWFEILSDVWRCLKVFSDVPRCFQIVAIFKDVLRFFLDRDGSSEMFSKVQRCFHALRDAWRCLHIGIRFDMFSNGWRCIETFLKRRRCLKMFEDNFRCLEMLKDVSRCSEIFSNSWRCKAFKLCSDILKCFRSFFGWVCIQMVRDVQDTLRYLFEM